jgi:hypothetical protein
VGVVYAPMIGAGRKIHWYTATEEDVLLLSIKVNLNMPKLQEMCFN